MNPLILKIRYRKASKNISSFFRFNTDSQTLKKSNCSIEAPVVSWSSSVDHSKPVEDVDIWKIKYNSQKY